MFYIALAAGIFFIEFAIKQWIETHKNFQSKDPVLGGKIIIKKHHNPGTAGQFFEKHQGFIGVLAFMLTISMAVVFGITLTKHGRGGLKAGMALLLGGALSNTYDRLQKKYVVDYINFPVKGKLGKLVFNIADFCILIGAAMICIFQK